MTVISTTNLNLVQQFEDELTRYEESLSEGISGLQHQASLLKLAIVTLLTAGPSDIYPLMRKLIERMSVGVKGAYSESTLISLAAETVDDQAKQYILNVVYVTHLHLSGGAINLTDEWFGLISYNQHVKQFIENLEVVDCVQCDHIHALPTEVVKISSNETLADLPLGNNLYTIDLTWIEPQTLSFSRSLDLSCDVQITQVIVNPMINQFFLSDTVKISANARHQITTLGLCPTGVVVGSPLFIITPGLFSPLRLGVVSTDRGGSWTVTSAEMLPPCLIRG